MRALRTSPLFAAIVSLVLLAPPGASAAAPPGPPPETWTLSFELTSTSDVGGATHRQKARGTAELEVGGDRRLTGDGRMSVEEHLSHPASGLRNELSGSGAFRVVGRREGDHLVVSFEGTIPLSGTSYVPQLGNTPADGSFDAGSVARGQRIERREDATATARISGQAGAQAEIVTTFRLSGGRNLAAAPTVPAGTFPERPNRWTLELLLEQRQDVHLQGVDQSTRLEISGSLEFDRPWADGPAKGHGALSGWTTTTRRSPRPSTFRGDLTGTLHLDGEVRDGVLTFVPRADLRQAALDDSIGASVRQTDPRGFDLFHGAGSVSIPLQDGAEVVVTAPGPAEPGASGSSTFTWRVRGKERQLWHVTVDCRRYAFTYFLSSSALNAGLWAEVVTEFDVELEEGKVVGGKGTRRLASLTSHSEPAGVWHAVAAHIQVQHARAPWVRDEVITSVTGSVGPGDVLAVSVPSSDMGLAWTITLDESAAAAHFPNWAAIRHRFSKRFTNSDTFGLPSYWEIPLTSPVEVVVRDEPDYKETVRARRVH